jgi:hypothetical protein
VRNADIHQETSSVQCQRPRQIGGRSAYSRPAVCATQFLAVVLWRFGDRSSYICPIHSRANTLQSGGSWNCADAIGSRLTRMRHYQASDLLPLLPSFGLNPLIAKEICHVEHGDLTWSEACLGVLQSHARNTPVHMYCHIEVQHVIVAY